MVGCRREEHVTPIMYYIYIIGNTEGKYYIGATSDLDGRLKKHNQQGSRWTKHKGPWELLHKEEFETKYEALHREHEIKSYKGGDAFKKLMRRDRVAAERTCLAPP